MGYVNQKNKNTMRDSSHLNFMGGASYDIKNPLMRLRLAAASCFFGEPMYYFRDEDDKRNGRPTAPHRIDDRTVSYLRETLNALDPQEWRGLTPAALMEKAIDEALDYDLEGTLQIAVALRNEDNIRTTPQVILVRAANHPKGKGPKATAKGSFAAPNVILKYACEIVTRADEPSVGLAYQLQAYGRKKIPNVLKKAWKSALERFDEYQLAKNRMENRIVKTLDVVRLVWPQGDAVKKLRDGTLKNTETWESIISSKGSTKESWSEALEVMGHMALLRNLRNLISKGIDPAAFREKFLAGAEKGRQLPFRYYSAYKAIEGSAPPSLLDTVEEALTRSLGNLPRFSGKVMSLCDNSGSATGNTTSKMGTMKVSSIGNLTGILTGMVADDGYVGVFGDRLEVMPIKKRSSIFDNLKKADEIGSNIGAGTENGIWLFWDKAIREKQHWDHVFVYSDMQAGHGGLYGIGTPYPVMPNTSNRIDVPKLISEYRRKVNPNVMVYLVQIAGYQDSIVPEFYDKTYILGGWGDGILRFAAEMSKKNEAPQQ
jgi:hypothetical protein